MIRSPPGSVAGVGGSENKRHGFCDLQRWLLISPRSHDGEPGHLLTTIGVGDRRTESFQSKVPVSGVPRMCSPRMVNPTGSHGLKSVCCRQGKYIANFESSALTQKCHRASLSDVLLNRATMCQRMTGQR